MVLRSQFLKSTALDIKSITQLWHKGRPLCQVVKGQPMATLLVGRQPLSHCLHLSTFSPSTETPNPPICSCVSALCPTKSLPSYVSLQAGNVSDYFVLPVSLCLGERHGKSGSGKVERSLKGCGTQVKYLKDLWIFRPFCTTDNNLLGYRKAQ